MWAESASSAPPGLDGSLGPSVAGAAGSQSAAPWLGAMHEQGGRGDATPRLYAIAARGRKVGGWALELRPHRYLLYVTDFIKNTARRAVPQN